MNIPNHRKLSLPWRLAIGSICLQLLYAVLAEAWIMLMTLPADDMRQSYERPDELAQTVTHIFATALLAGLVTWYTAQRWLIRQGTDAVDRPGRMMAVLLAVSLVCCLLNKAAIMLLNEDVASYVEPIWLSLEHRFGMRGTMAGFLLISAPFILLDALGNWLAVRVAAMSVKPVADGRPPRYLARHAAWIAATTLLLGQIHLSLVMVIVLGRQMPADLLGYALSCWVLPAVIWAVAVVACLKTIPTALGTAGIGRAIAHGSFAFLAALYLTSQVIQAMTWDEWGYVLGSIGITAAFAAGYIALLALGCMIGARIFYGARQEAKAA